VQESFCRFLVGVRLDGKILCGNSEWPAIEMPVERRE
jgi:hypothetical protein